MSFVDPRIHPGSPKLREEDVVADPIEQFQRWFRDAVDAKLEEPEAMTLATCTRDGRPSARMVLLRGVDKRGFVFYTNYTSRKARELEENPRAALVFFWDLLDRQVRVEGRVERTTAEESDAYFHSRPRGSRIGAWASPQSQILANRAALEEMVEEMLRRHGTEGPVPRPPYWGGYRVVPELIEFWQGQPNRLHDRLRYRRTGETWIIERLAP